VESGTNPAESATELFTEVLWKEAGVEKARWILATEAIQISAPSPSASAQVGLVVLWRNCDRDLGAEAPNRVCKELVKGRKAPRAGRV
jgi:hypothetical protein